MSNLHHAKQVVIFPHTSFFLKFLVQKKSRQNLKAQIFRGGLVLDMSKGIFWISAFFPSTRTISLQRLQGIGT